MSPTHQDLSNDTTFSQIKSRVPVPLRAIQSDDCFTIVQLHCVAYTGESRKEWSFDILNNSQWVSLPRPVEVV